MKKMIIKNKAAVRFTILLTVLLLICSTSVWAQPLPDPDAHYPLRVDKYRNYVVVQPWDVSGNANHGSTYDARSGGDTLMDASFRRINFPDTAVTGVGYSYPCLQKENTNDAHINIPDVYNATYSVSFWVYYTSGLDAAIVKLPTFTILIKSGKVHAATNNGTSVNGKTTAATGFSGGAGWYFVCVKSVDSVYIVKHGGTSVSKKQMSTNFNGPGYSTNTSQLLESSFVGGLNNVRFYSQNLTDDDVDNIYDQDVDIAAKDYNKHMYIIKNVYAHYPLSNSDFKKNVSRFPGRNGTVVSGVTGATDRFSRADSAASFPTSNAYITLPDFWGTYMDNYNIYTNDTPKGFTISYWMNITSSMSTPAGGINMPFGPSDHRTKVFYGRESSQDVFGMQQILDRIGIYRYNDITASRYPWYLWLYDPMSFRSTTGWYHIVWVQYQDWMRMYIYKPDGKMVCNSYYIEIPEAIKTITEWGLGNNAGSSTAQSLILDDFKIFNWPLNPYDVHGLDSLERPPSQPLAKGGCQPCLTLGDPWSDSKPVSDKFVMYPNPAQDKVTLRMNVNQDEQVMMSISAIDGKVYMTKEYDLHKGANIIELNNLSMPPGTYFVTILNSKSLSGSYKLTLLPH